jgi:hypothetical protein
MLCGFTFWDEVTNGRVAVEQTCKRCNQAAFHPIAKCGLAKLREYGERIISLEGDMGMIIFSRVWFGF